MAPFPGIPEEALAAVGDPNPVDAGELRKALAPFADPPDAPLAVLLEFGRLLLAANTVVNLTGAKNWDTLTGAHLLDCVHAAAFVPHDARFLADWGSGAGLPGLVWAALFPEKRILLIERTGKKSDFLKEAVMRLELFNVEVAAGQGEFALKQEERPDLIVARAVEPIGKLLERLRRNKISPRTLFLMLGPKWEEEWEQVDPDLRRRWGVTARHPYELGGGRGRRFVAAFKPK